MKDTIILIAWFVGLIVGLVFIAGPKEMSFEQNRRRSLVAGSIITGGTLLLMALVSKTDLGNYVKEFIVMLGSVIGGGLLLQGMQKKIV